KRKGLLPFLFIAFFGLLYATPAQAEEGVLDKKITIIAEQKEVRDVLNEITRLVEIKFVYSAQKIPSRKKVSILANDKRVGDVLDLLCEPLNVLYYVSGNQVVLMKKVEHESIIVKLNNFSDNKKPITRDLFYKNITGRVTNDKGEGLQGVSVTVKGTTRG